MTDKTSEDTGDKYEDRLLDKPETPKIIVEHCASPARRLKEILKKEGVVINLDEPGKEKCKHEDVLQGNPDPRGELLIGQLNMEWCPTCGKIFWISTFYNDKVVMWKPEEEIRQLTRKETAMNMINDLVKIIEPYPCPEARRFTLIIGSKDWKHFRKKYGVE